MVTNGYLINQSVVDNTSTQIKWYDNTKNEWVKKNVLAYKAKGNCLELAVSRKDLGLLEDAFVFDFKWADNPKELKDPISYVQTEILHLIADLIIVVFGKNKE